MTGIGRYAFADCTSLTSVNASAILTQDNLNNLANQGVLDRNQVYVVIGDNQHFYGYTLFLYKNHNHTELFQLEKDERKQFMEEMIMVAEAVGNAFHPEKMNHELLEWVTHIFTGIFIRE